MPLSTGSVLKGNIVLERELGHGAMGTVWLAENRSLGSKVAVKVLRGASHDDAMRARFAQEARSAARIDSPHVVKIFDFDVTDEGEMYFVMEVLRGVDLRAHIEQKAPLSLAETASIVRQTCRALESAHALGIVHRDIKPANIFIQESGGEPFVKVLDFGVAKLLGADDLGMTSTGMTMGTPYYMSPEQFTNPRDVDPRSDLWSTAVVIYACLTGALPFLGETVGALTMAVHQGAFTLPSQTRPELSPAIDAWFRRSLDPRREGRFQSARELADSFEAVARESMTAQVPSAPAAAPVAALQGTQLMAPSQAQMPAPTYASAPMYAPMPPMVAAPSPAMTAAPAMAYGAVQPMAPPLSQPMAPPLSQPTAPPPSQAVAPSRRSPLLWLAPLVLLFLAGGAYALVGGSGSSQDEAGAELRAETPSAGAQEASASSSGVQSSGVQSSTAAPKAAAPSTKSAGMTAQPTKNTAPAAAKPSTTSSSPTPSTKPRWRKRNMRCKQFDTSKSCASCCPQGDMLEPYPSCECLFDGEKWDREHGVSR